MDTPTLNVTEWITVVNMRSSKMEKRIVPRTKRGAGLHSTVRQADTWSVFAVCETCHGKERQAALRRLTFVYQAMLAHS